MPLPHDVHDAGACLFDYLAMPGAIAPATADAVIVLGSKYTDVARFAGELCACRHYPVVVFTGNRGRNTATQASTEAELFEQIARPLLPPTTRVLLEKEATNTAENLRLSLRLLSESGVSCRRLVSIQNPTGTRRTRAAFAKQFPELEVTCLSPDRTYDDCLSSMEARSLIDDMVGNLQRILVYPALGYQMEQVVPEPVLEAYRFLLSRGFDRQLFAGGEV